MGQREETDYDHGPCPCAKGRLVVKRVDYDQMYGGVDLEAYITCAECAAKYEINPRLGLLDRAEYAAASARRAASQPLWEALDRNYCAPVAQHLEALVRAAGRSKVKWELALAKYGLTEPLNRMPLSAYVRSAVTVGNIEALRAALGMPLDPELKRKLDEYRIASDGVRTPSYTPLPPSRGIL